MSYRSVFILVLFSGVFSAAIVFANIAAGIKLSIFLGLIVPAGTIAYSVTFPVTDIVDEVYGRRVAVYIVWAGLVAEIVSLILIGVEDLVPALDPAMEEMYKQVFHPQIRIVLASIIAYIVSQHHDVWAFWKWREVTHGKHLWLRNNASTSISQLIDTTLFTLIAFYGLYSINTILEIIISMWLFKLLIAILDTPFVYIGVELIKKYIAIEDSIEPRITPVKPGTL